MTRRLLAAVVSMLAAGSACAPAGPQIAVRDAWSRPTIAATAAVEDTPVPDAPGVVYLVVENNGRQADRLLGASTDVARVVEIHETRLAGDRMRMVPVEGGLEVPPQGALELRPGSYHMMLIGLRRHLRVGEPFDVELRLERSGPLVATVEVRRP